MSDYLIRYSGRVIGVIGADDLEEVFEIGNDTEHRTPMPRDSHYYGMGWQWSVEGPLRSMSVGDTIEDIETGQVWVVASTGFVKQEEYRPEVHNPLGHFLANLEVTIDDNDDIDIEF